MVRMLHKWYENDRWMDFNLIKRESNLAGYLFVWSNKLLEFMDVSNKMTELGINGIEQEITTCKQRKVSIETILDFLYKQKQRQEEEKQKQQLGPLVPQNSVSHSE